MAGASGVVAITRIGDGLQARRMDGNRVLRMAMRGGGLLSARVHCVRLVAFDAAGQHGRGRPPLQGKRGHQKAGQEQSQSDHLAIL